MGPEQAAPSVVPNDQMQLMQMMQQMVTYSMAPMMAKVIDRGGGPAGRVRVAGLDAAGRRRRIDTSVVAV